MNVGITLSQASASPNLESGTSFLLVPYSETAKLLFQATSPFVDESMEKEQASHRDPLCLGCPDSKQSWLFPVAKWVFVRVLCGMTKWRHLLRDMQISPFLSVKFSFWSVPRDCWGHHVHEDGHVGKEAACEQQAWVILGGPSPCGCGRGKRESTVYVQVRRSCEVSQCHLAEEHNSPGSPHKLECRMFLYEGEESSTAPCAWWYSASLCWPIAQPGLRTWFPGWRRYCSPSRQATANGHRTHQE